MVVGSGELGRTFVHVPHRLLRKPLSFAAMVTIAAPLAGLSLAMMSSSCPLKPLRRAQ